MIPGVDVYEGYGAIDWNLVKASGVRFAWIKCYEGNEGKDPAYERNMQRAREVGIHAAPYFFAFPLPYGEGKPKLRAPHEQAELFFKAYGSKLVDAGELSPAIDLEWPEPENWAKWECTAEQISEWCRECCEAMTILFARLPIIYTYPWWWKAVSVANVSWAGRYPLWMANYTYPGEGVPPLTAGPIVPPPWQNWHAWQHSAKGSSVRVPGIPACPVDRDVIRSEVALRELLGMSENDIDTEPHPVPPVRPSTLQSKTIVDWDIVRPDVPLPKNDPPPDDVA
jgi:lysozyme